MTTPIIGFVGEVGDVAEVPAWVPREVADPFVVVEPVVSFRAVVFLTIGKPEAARPRTLFGSPVYRIFAGALCNSFSGSLLPLGLRSCEKGKLLPEEDLVGWAVDAFLVGGGRPAIGP